MSIREAVGCAVARCPSSVALWRSGLQRAVARPGWFALRPGCVMLSLVLIAVLTSCATSASLRFYTLSAVPAAGGDAAIAPATPAIRVGRVKIPAELDRSELVQRIDANRVRIAELDRWAAPLDDMIRRVLSADLQGRAAAAASDAVLSLEIDEFIGDSRCGVTLRASWELKGAAGGGASMGSGREVINVPSGASSGACPFGALPAPMSQALAELSERILSAARRLSPS